MIFDKTINKSADRVAVRISNREVQSICDSVTVISANLWHDWPRYRRIQERLESFARMVECEHANVVLVQEVARTNHVQVNDWLYDRLGMSYMYARANGHKEGIGFEEGIAVLSKFPLGVPRLKRLGTRRNPLVNRFALGTTIHSPCGNLFAFSVHLGLLSRDNQRQLVDLQRWIESVAGTKTALIGGDFNANESTPQIQHAKRTWVDTFRYLHPVSDGSTHELRWPWGSLLRRARLDYIFLKQGGSEWNIVEARHLKPKGKTHSDHQAILLRLARGATNVHTDLRLI